MPADSRPVSGNDLADALMGAKFRTVANALAEIDRIADEALLDDRAFERGGSDPKGRIALGLKKRAASQNNEEN